MTQYKILVVDDNADIRELLEILLTSEGYAVTLASSGEQALQLLSPELPTTTCQSPSPMRSSPPGSRACCGATGCIRARANPRRTNGWCAGRCASTALIMR